MNQVERESMSEQLSKLPALTAMYWLLKITATTVGETAGDLMSMTMEVGYGLSTVILMSLFFMSAAGSVAYT
jgi:uncharacterized membrane-anchored protein